MEQACPIIMLPSLAPDHEDLLGFGTPDRVDFLADAAIAQVTLEGAGKLLVSLQDPLEQPSKAPSTLYKVGKHAAAPRGRGRPPKPVSTDADDKVDGRARKQTTWIEPAPKREMIAAFNHMFDIGKEPTANIYVHPAYLPEGQYPDDLSAWFKDDLRNRLARRFKDREGWYCIWTREAYTKPRSEHWQGMVHLEPEPVGGLVASMTKLRSDVLGWYPGADPRLVEVTPVAWKLCEDGIWQCVHLGYHLKQMTPQAQGSPYDKQGRPRLHRMTREKERDGFPVAPVLGRKTGVSNSLNAKARALQETRHRIAHERLVVAAAKRAGALPPPMGSKRPTIIPSTSIISPTGIM